jgi:hypothetical protein
MVTLMGAAYRVVCVGVLGWLAAACTISNPAFGSLASGENESVAGTATGGESTSLESGSVSESGQGSTTRDSSDSQTGDASTKGSTDSASDTTASDGSFIDATETRTSTDAGGASDGEAETAACDPLTEDASEIGKLCSADNECPEAYVCMEIIGVQAQHLCVIFCQMDCECPGGTTCELMADKEKQWHECRP